MFIYVLRRALYSLPVLLIATFLVFAMVSATFDPTAKLAQTRDAANQRRELKQELGLDRPLLVQYGSFLQGLARGDLGVSLRNDQPVLQQILERMPATAELAFASMAVAVLIALPLGIIAAVWRGTAVDYGAMTLSLVGISVPNFWLGPLLAIVFAVELGWLPVGGRGTLAHLVLPSVTLGAALAAILARMTRASLLEELREPYVLAARAKGVSRTRAVLHHALRNSLIPIVTILGLQFGVVLTGAVITETIFAWPGIGRLLIQSISFRDYPTVQGCVLLIAVTYVGVNLITDLTYGFLDPRIRVDRS
jgi:peptide/nickel transport system permease protein